MWTGGFHRHRLWTSRIIDLARYLYRIFLAASHSYIIKTPVMQTVPINGHPVSVTATGHKHIVHSSVIRLCFIYGMRIHPAIKIAHAIHI